MSAIFDEDKLSTKDSQENVERVKSVQDGISSIIFIDVDTANRDLVVDIAREAYRQHGAKHLEILPMRILGEGQKVNRYYCLFCMILEYFFPSYLRFNVNFICRSF